MDMPEHLAKRLKALQREGSDEGASDAAVLALGFNTCWNEMQPLVEALEFYTTDCNWDIRHADKGGAFSNAESDAGLLAREALTKIGKV